MSVRLKFAVYFFIVFFVSVLYGAVFDDESRNFKDFYCDQMLK